MPPEYLPVSFLAALSSPIKWSSWSVRARTSRGGMRCRRPASSRVSRPVENASRVAVCMARPSRLRTSPGSAVTSYPATRAPPEVGLSNVDRMRMVVVFPAPLGPRKPNSSPRSTSKLTSSTARDSPYTLTRSWTSMTAELV